MAYVIIDLFSRFVVGWMVANARRSNPTRDRIKGRLRSGLLTVGEHCYVITYERRLARRRHRKH